MRHPFDGIVTPNATRRSWLKVFTGAVAGWFGLASVSQAVAPPRHVKLEPHASPEPGKPVTKALIPSETGGNPVTLALNEAGGRPMTRALNEQGGRITTKALGEEGAARPPVQVTTLAVGEEGGKN